MKKGVGYLDSMTNPNFSGLAKVVFRDELVPTEQTVYTTCHAKGGHGVRQIIGALGRSGRLVQESARILVEYRTDETGLLQALSVEEQPA